MPAFITSIASIASAGLVLLTGAASPNLAEAQARQVAGEAAPAAAPPKAVILVDVGHGETFFQTEPGRETAIGLQYREIARYLGAEVRVTNEPFAKATLEGVKTLLVLGPVTAFEPAEIAAVAEFVKQGGALMVGTDEEIRQNIANTRLNDLLAPFTLKFTGDTPVLHNRGAAATAGRIHPALREVPYSGGRAVEGGTPFSFILDADGTPSKMAHASWAEFPGGGRVIAMGEMMAPRLLGTASAVRLGGAIRPNDFGPYWGKDSREFMVEILSWLTYRMR